jgi:hypothetical protein
VIAMTRRSSAVAAFFKVASLVIFLSLVGCGSGSKTSSRLRDALMTEQTASHIVIGYRDREELDYIDLTAGNTFKRVLLPVQPKITRIMDVRSVNGVQESPDGIWIASCVGKVACQINERNDPGRRLSVSREHTLTPLYWSPDDRFVFLVEKAPKWRFPPRCSFEDERDVIVYDTSTGKSDTLATVCGGFPYGSLRWYELTAA